jgi:hypothetical protein
MPVPGMKNSGSIIAGVGNLYISEIGEAFPVLTEDVLTWGGGWTKMTVATKGGYALNYKENTTPLTIDQQGTPVLYMPANSEGSVEINLAEVDLERLAFLLSNATLDETPADISNNVGIRRLSFGGNVVKEFQIGIEGLSSSNPDGEEWWELIKVWKCIPNSEFKKSYKKEELQMVVGKWDIAADLTKAAGHEMFEIIEKSEASQS